VTTIGRGSAADAFASLAVAGGPHAVVPAPLGRHEDASFANAWPALVAAERGLRRILRHRPATLLHLRMADVGSLAAARIARRQGLPFVFTLAPDPHAVIAEMERSGELDRATFGPADARSALWFRARIVRHLADAADQVVLFPRSELVGRLRDLLGIDVAGGPGRYHVVSEGIDPEPVRRARAEAARIGDDPAPVASELRDGIAALGPARRGLPLVVSVGRLTEVKGMARLVEAFAADERLRRRANLVIVGGDLDDPTAEERAEIDRIEAAFVECPELAEGLVLLGHRPHDDVLRVLAIAEAGLLPWAAPGGAYACGSRKEEFGLAIVEALGIGLPVVAPLVGGPASYVEEGLTGQLVDTLDAAALAAGIHGALDLAWLPGRAERARRLVEDRFTIRAMTDALAPIYWTAHPARVPVAA
jgi:glycosyltransferase involved in cell wall biosynthesis